MLERRQIIRLGVLAHYVETPVNGGVRRQGKRFDPNRNTNSMAPSIKDTYSIDWSQSITEWDTADTVVGSVPISDRPSDWLGTWTQEIRNRGFDSNISGWLRDIANTQPLDSNLFPFADMLSNTGSQSKKEPELDDNDKYLERMGCLDQGDNK